MSTYGAGNEPGPYGGQNQNNQANAGGPPQGTPKDFNDLFGIDIPDFSKQVSKPVTDPFQPQEEASVSVMQP